MSTGLSGGSSATDFQPVTRNPQSDVGSGLQSGSSNLQPISSSDQSNSFNQPGINPQAFPNTTNLRVLGGDATANTVSSQPDPVAQGWGTLTVFFVVFVVIAVILLTVIKISKPAGVEDEKQPDETQTVTKPPKTKKKPKNKNKPKKKRR